MWAALTVRRALVAGNWKMNGTVAEATALAAGTSSWCAELPTNAGVAEIDVALFPAFVHLPDTLAAVDGVSVGAQNVHSEAAGAHTGEVSAGMLADLGVVWTLVGHSERRAAGETDAAVAAKAAAGLQSGLTPVVCVGETLDERDAGNAEAVVLAQLGVVLNELGQQQLSQCVVAYEPVWAIGTGRTATAAQAQSMHASIRQWLAQSGCDSAEMRLLYGGSVKPNNALELFLQPDVDGGLIGGAALVLTDFLAICQAGVDATRSGGG